MATRCHSNISLLCCWSPGCCRSSAESIFCFVATTDYHSCEDSGSCPVSGSNCGSGSISRGFLWFITVGCFFFPIGWAVPLPSVAWTPSSFRSASRHGPFHCRFPDTDVQGAGPVHGTRLPTVPGPGPITCPETRSVCDPFPVAVPVFHPLQLMGPVSFPLDVLGTVKVTCLWNGSVCSPAALRRRMVLLLLVCIWGLGCLLARSLPSQVPCLLL